VCVRERECKCFPISTPLDDLRIAMFRSVNCRSLLSYSSWLSLTHPEFFLSFTYTACFFLTYSLTLNCFSSHCIKLTALPSILLISPADWFSLNHLYRLSVLHTDSSNFSTHPLIALSVFLPGCLSFAPSYPCFPVCSRSTCPTGYFYCYCYYRFLLNYYFRSFFPIEIAIITQ
jgi:hypothetical protein